MRLLSNFGAMTLTHFYFQLVEKMPIVKPEITELNVHVLLIS